jgi:ubiquinone/menaquinone biosynthesis C-methylase UbiE
VELTEAERERAQSFDRIAEAYDRLGGIDHQKVLLGSWLEGRLPATGRRALDLGCGTGRHAVLLAQRFDQVDAVDLSGPMVALARTRRARPNITYRQGDLQGVGGPGSYDFVTSVLTLHHVPDLHAALSHIKGLVAPGGRIVLVDQHPPESRLRPTSPVWRLERRLLPLRVRLHGLAVLRLGRDAARRGPGTAWELYRLSTRREWLDHLVTDRFFSREELQGCCDRLFPGYQLVPAPGGTALTWNAPAAPDLR